MNQINFYQLMYAICISLKNCKYLISSYHNALKKLFHGFKKKVILEVSKNLQIRL